MVYYTLTPRSLNKTACAAVLHGSMFSKPCAPAQGVCRAHAQPRKRRLWGYYTLTPRSGSQTKPHVLRFCMVHQLKALCAGTGACAVHTCSRASGGFGLLYLTPRKQSPVPGRGTGGSVQRTVVTRREMSSFSLGSGSSLIEPRASAPPVGSFQVSRTARGRLCR